jgi:acyl-homoserine lactone acylase PvdQ
LRAIYDLGSPQASVWVQSTGQVGQPMSSLYDSMLLLWRDVQYLPMRPTTRGARELELKPVR